MLRTHPVRMVRSNDRIGRTRHGKSEGTRPQACRSDNVSRTDAGAHVVAIFWIGAPDVSAHPCRGRDASPLIQELRSRR